MPSEPAPYVVVRPPGRKPYVLTIDQLTAHVRAARELRTMGRLADKLSKASDAIAGVEMAVEKDVDALIERTKLVHQKREAAFMKKHVALDGQITDLSEFEKDLEAFDGKNEPSGGGTLSGDAYVETRLKS